MNFEERLKAIDLAFRGINVPTKGKSAPLVIPRTTPQFNEFHLRWWSNNPRKGWGLGPEKHVYFPMLNSALLNDEWMKGRVLHLHSPHESCVDQQCFEWGFQVPESFPTGTVRIFYEENYKFYRWSELPKHVKDCFPDGSNYDWGCANQLLEHD